MNLRVQLENLSLRYNYILQGAANQEIGEAVDIDNESDQGAITDRVILDDTTFASDSATSCLILFATGTIQGRQGPQQVAVGAHLDDQVYTGPDETVATMVDMLELGEGNDATSGGEVSRNTNPVGNSTMDYSRYCPFFLAISNNDNATFGNYNFPSNGNGGTSTGAALTPTAIHLRRNE